MLKYQKNLQFLNAIGTDGEEQLRNAFVSIFPGAVTLLCSIHKRDNIKMKLRELSVSEHHSKDILDSIFGYQLGATLFTGLIDAEDVSDFKSKLEELKPTWNKICPDFYEWFVCRQAELFCSSMIRSVRTSAGLGCPPHSYTTNNNESINRVLKGKVCYKKQEWPEFNNIMFQVVKDQQEEFSKAVCGCGEYELIDDYKSLEVPHTEWIRMTPEQRKVKVEKVMKHALEKLPVLQSGPSTHSSTSNSKLSIHWKDAQITHLQLSRVADLWKKAEEILNTPNFVVIAAGNTQARQVASVTGCTSKGVSPPHFVYAKKLGGASIQVHCDCPISTLGGSSR